MMTFNPPIPPAQSKCTAPPVLGVASRTWPVVEARGELLVGVAPFVGVVRLVAFFAPKLVPGAAISRVKIGGMLS